MCDDMFIYSKWNGTTTYGFGANERDFGTDYGICCWYTPQLNFSAIPDGKIMKLLKKFTLTTYVCNELIFYGLHLIV